MLFIAPALLSAVAFAFIPAKQAILTENTPLLDWRPDDAWDQRVKVPGNGPVYYYSDLKDHILVIDSLNFNTCPVDT
jgi:hypothetical protein